MTYNIHWLHLFGGRLAISLVYNPGIAMHMERKYSVRFDRIPDDNGWFLTIHIRNRFLNVDWC